MENKLLIKGDNYDIPAILTYPDENKKVPAIILCHGTASSKDEVGNMYIMLANELLKHKIASIRFDYAGCGESKALPQDLTFYGEVNDTYKVYEFLQKCNFIDNEKIGILGLSQGARIMAEIFKIVPELKFGVSWSGACQSDEGLFEMWHQNYYTEACKNGYAVVPMTWGDNLIISKQWFDDIKKSTPLEGLKNYKGPVLAVAGVKDDIIPFEHTSEIIKVCNNSESRAIIYPNSNHIFNILSDDLTTIKRVIKETIEWINKILN